MEKTIVVSRPSYTIIYDGKNISADVSESLIDLTYTDKVTGEADELEITLEDKFGKWQNEWYPQKGSYITATIGIGGVQLPCGVFQIDQIEFSGPPDMITIKALSTGFYGKIRNRKGYAHENKTLAEIVRTVAGKIKYKVVGNIENVKVGRSTQNRESDLQYLNRLAAQYGYNFTIKDKTLVFIKQTELEARSTSLSVDKTETTEYGFKDKTSEIFKATQIKFHNPNSNKVISATKQATFQGQESDYTDQLDTLEIREKAENEEQANIKAEAYTHKFVSLQQTGSFSTVGNPLLVSGNNIDLTGFGAFAGIWHILTSTHTINTDGYQTAVEMKRINVPSSESKKKPKKITTNQSFYKVK